ELADLGRNVVGVHAKKNKRGTPCNLPAAAREKAQVGFGQRRRVLERAHIVLMQIARKRLEIQDWLVARTPAVWNRLVEWIQARDFDAGISLLVIGAIIGLAAGLGVVAFYLLIDGSYAVLTAWPAAHVPFAGRAILRVVCTSVGVWLAWFITHRA